MDAKKRNEKTLARLESVSGRENRARLIAIISDRPPSRTVFRGHQAIVLEIVTHGEDGFLLRAIRWWMIELSLSLSLSLSLLSILIFLIDMPAADSKCSSASFQLLFTRTGKFRNV